MTARKSIRHDLGRVLAGDFTSQVLAIVRGLIIPLLLTPGRYGLWRILLVVWQYGAYLHLGSFALLNRELPSLFPAGEVDRISELRRTAFWGTVAVSLVAALGIAIYSLSPISGADNDLLWALRISAIGLIAQQIFFFILVDFRVRAQFGQMSLVRCSQAAATLILMVPLGYIAGVPGLAAGMTLATVLVIFGFSRREVFEPPLFDRAGFLNQIVKGAPLSALPFFNTAISSVGQIVAAGLLGLEATGLYGFGVMIGTVVYAIPRALGLVLYPRYLTSSALNEGSLPTNILLRGSLRVTSVMSILSVCSAAVLIAPVYRYFFPAYFSALPSTYALLAMMPFLSYALVLQNALLALRLHKKVILLQVSFIALSAGFSICGALLFEDVTWVALGVMLANIGYGLGSMWMALRATKIRGQNTLSEFLVELSPVVFVGCVTTAMIRFWKPSGDISSWVTVTIGQLLVLCPIAAFLLLRLWRTHRRAT